MKELKETKQLIQEYMRKIVRGDSSEIAILHGSIQLAQETVFQNLFNEGDSILVVGTEYSASRLEMMAKLSKLKTISIPVNEELPYDTILEVLNKEDIKAILLPLVEEGSGVFYRLRELHKVIHDHNVLLIVSVDDSLLMNPFYFEEAGVDVAISALMNPIHKTNFSFVALSSKAYERLLTNPHHFLNLKKMCELDNDTCEKELVLVDTYKELANLLRLITYYEMWQWNHYFGALTTYLRNTISQIGYHTIPIQNHSNSHILIKLDKGEDALWIRNTIYKMSHLVIDVQDEYTLVINMNHYMHIFDTLRLIDALSKIRDTCQGLK